MFSNVETERLKKWLNNVRRVKKEYELREHDGSFGCMHCIEAERNRLDNDGQYKCDHCIWITIAKCTCTVYLRSNCNMTFISDEMLNEVLYIHLARCDEWITLIAEELNKRSLKR